MASFNGQTFKTLVRSGPTRTQEAAVSVRHVPGGNQVVIDIGGRTAPALALEILATAAEYTALLGQVGASGSLVYVHGTVQALLWRLVQTQRLTDDDGHITASAEFYLL